MRMQPGSPPGAGGRLRDAVGTNKLEDTVNDLVSLVKPGGWIQLVEMEWNGWNVGLEGRIFHNAIRGLFSIVSVGQGVDVREKVTPMLKEAGLQNSDYKIITTPFCMTTKMLPPINVSREQLDMMPQKLIEAKKDGWEFKIFSLWAQKPEN
ncbi:hypothetical protein P171DRAFT_484523 [Karstenula rhodostoma CBS 690.94]|uniref:Uncharacterized protein n=1 Tax=Karstenula rhodostoma CBS 690.94 TaxID=1392251 RepID=A0A9P4UE56_9PLEO|nr:hypothetical protein P171DRAFT_484523 [Karstenula rhodostoma CBS 690.94]